MARKRIGLLGGSFDPVHIAHIALAKAALQSLQLTEVQLLPAANPWQKQSLGADEMHRLAMLQLAIKDEPSLLVNPIEIERGGATYTYDTVSQLPSEHTYFWIIGSDQLQRFPTWNRWQDILQYVELAVAQRPNEPLVPPLELENQLHLLGKTLHTIDFAPTPLSATLIRERLQQHQSVATLVPPSVEHYIQQHHLYKP